MIKFHVQPLDKRIVLGTRRTFLFVCRRHTVDPKLLVGLYPNFPIFQYLSRAFEELERKIAIGVIIGMAIYAVFLNKGENFGIENLVASKWMRTQKAVSRSQGLEIRKGKNDSQRSKEKKTGPQKMDRLRPH
jgi:hypothetical protein